MDTGHEELLRAVEGLGRQKKGNDEPDAPKTSEALPVVKWTKASRDCLHCVIVVRTIPLAHAIRPSGVAPFWSRVQQEPILQQDLSVTQAKNAVTQLAVAHVRQEVK